MYIINKYIIENHVRNEQKLPYFMIIGKFYEWVNQVVAL